MLFTVLGVIALFLRERNNISTVSGQDERVDRQGLVKVPPVTTSDGREICDWCEDSSLHLKEQINVQIEEPSLEEPVDGQSEEQPPVEPDSVPGEEQPLVEPDSVHGEEQSLVEPVSAHDEEQSLVEPDSVPGEEQPLVEPDSVHGEELLLVEPVDGHSEDLASSSSSSDVPPNIFYESSSSDDFPQDIYSDGFSCSSELTASSYSSFFSAESGCGDDPSTDFLSAESGCGDDPSTDFLSAESGCGEDHSTDFLSAESGCGEDPSTDFLSAESGCGDDPPPNVVSAEPGCSHDDPPPNVVSAEPGCSHDDPPNVVSAEPGCSHDDPPPNVVSAEPGCSHDEPPNVVSAEPGCSHDDPPNVVSAEPGCSHDDPPPNVVSAEPGCSHDDPPPNVVSAEPGCSHDDPPPNVVSAEPGCSHDDPPNVVSAEPGCSHDDPPNVVSAEPGCSHYPPPNVVSAEPGCKDDVAQGATCQTEGSVPPQPEELKDKDAHIIEINSKCYKIGAKLGKGGFGTVFAGTRLEDGLKVAVKMADFKNKRYIRVVDFDKLLPAEIALHFLATKGPKAKQIVELLDWKVEADQYFMVLERPIRFVSLGEFIRKHRGNIAEKVLRKIMFQATIAADICCKRGVFHRDIKPDNLLINPRTYEVKLIDFGCGDRLTKTCYREYSGTIQFSPPEFLKIGYYFGEPATVWSLGILQYWLMFKKHPDIHDLPKMTFRNLQQYGWSDECGDFIRCCLQKNYNFRHKLNALRTHDWFKAETKR